MLLSGRASISENILSVVDKWSTGYLVQATKIRDYKQFLSDYHIVLDKDLEDSNHTDVHPPGNTLLSYVLLKITSENISFIKPIINNLLPAWLFPRIEFMVKDIAISQGVKSDSARVVTYTASLIVLLFLLAISFANIILILSYLNFNKDFSNIGILSFFLWTIPAPILFLGSYDTLYYFLTSISCYIISLWFKYDSKLYLSLLGFYLGICVFFSLGFGCIIVLSMLLILLHHNINLKKSISSIVYLLLGGGVSIILFYIFNIKIIEIAFLVMRNNARFFNLAQRSSWWIMINYLDYILFVGVINIVAIFISLKRKKYNKLLFIPQKLTIAYIIVLILLFISNFSRGEMGRLVLLLIPFNILITFFSLQNFLRNNKYSLYLLVIAISLIQVVLLRMNLKTVFIIS